MTQTRIAELELRVAEYEQAIGTFARLHEELVDLRRTALLPETVVRLDAMLQLNAQTLESIKQSLALAMAMLRRLQPAEETSVEV